MKYFVLIMTCLLLSSTVAHAAAPSAADDIAAINDVLDANRRLECR
ncbi:MAG: hypothetical protein ACI9UK_001327 [Candidatus Krumholzibacteriia bacterium]|jgi:hypothetical protein